MVFSVLLLLYRESLSIKNPTENLARELHRWANEHAAHEHAPRGGGVQRQRADFFSRRSADPHYSREKVGATRHSGVGMWVKAAWRGGGKILGLLASVCFLLISRLPVLHEQLTTTLRSAASAVSGTWQPESFFICLSGARCSGEEPTCWVYRCHRTGFIYFFSWMFEFQFIPLAVFKVGIDSVKFTEQENKNTTRFLSFLQHEMKWDVVFFFFFVRWRVVAVSSDWGFVDSDTKVCTNTENFFWCGWHISVHLHCICCRSLTKSIFLW